MKVSGRKTPRILIADDQGDVREALHLLFKGEGYKTDTVHSLSLALETIKENEFDLVLIDLNYARDTTSGQEGMDLLTRILSIDSTIPVVVMTAWANIELAVEAIKRGARDFVQKPWENTRLLSIAKTQIELKQALQRGERLAAENKLLRGESVPRLLAESRAMRPVIELIERIGPSDANVLITGEHGTGKGLVAQVLHALSERANKPFLTVNTGALPESVFESELFGHVRGAFTDARTDRVGRFELADGGTLFLDEIANVPLKHQAKILRVIETGEFERVGSSKTIRADVRIISATNAELPAEVAAGRFRQDLLYRLNTVEIHIPPLRERGEDIPHLAAHFLGENLRKYRKGIAAFEESALQTMLGYSWPGNIRELSHAVERGVLMCQGERIQPSDLGLPLGRGPDRASDEMSLEQVERLLIKKALARHDGNASKAAQALGLSRSAFYRRLQKYGL